MRWPWQKKPRARVGSLAQAIALQAKENQTARKVRKRTYEAASRRRRWNDWNASQASANAEIGPVAATLRARCRDLSRNNAWAGRIVDTRTECIVGTGIRARALSRSDAFNELFNRLFHDWAMEECCVNRRETLYAKQAIAVRGVDESGRCFVRRINAPKSEGLRIPLQLQVLEADYLADHLDGAVGKKRFDHGIEYQGAKIVAYHFYRDHPGDRYTFTARLDTVRVPAKDVIDLQWIHRGRPGQWHGVPQLVRAAGPIKDTGDYTRAQILKQKIAACFGLIVETTPAPGDTITDTVLTDADGDIVEDLFEGMIAYVSEGKKITVLEPPSVADYAAFVREKAYEIATGGAVPYSEMTGDYRQYSFSSARASRQAFYRTIDADRTLSLEPLLCRRIGKWFVEAAVAAGRLTVPNVRIGWSTPHRPSVNPVQDAMARQMELRDGLITHGMAAASMGNDIDTVWRERAREKAKAEKLGLTFDANPWDMTKSGTTQITVEAEGGTDATPPEDTERALSVVS